MTGIQERLAQLQHDIDAKKEDIALLPHTGSREAVFAWADQKQKLAKLIEEHELLAESERIAAAIREWEEMHPPITEDCPVCLEPMQRGIEGSKSERCDFCLQYVCRECKEKMPSVKGGTSCPLCRHVETGDENERLDRVRKQAERGQVEAQFLLGLKLYVDGYKSESESIQKEAMEWVALAAEQQHPEALYFLGEAYYSGNDDERYRGLVEQSSSKAFILLEQAAKLGYWGAHEKLSLLYALGEGVEMDELKSTYHVSIAYGVGRRKISSARLGFIFADGRCGLPRSSVLAKHYFEESSIEHEHQPTDFLLGRALWDLCLEQYDGRNAIPGHSCIPKTLYWYRKAAACANADQDEFVIESWRGMENMARSHCANCSKMKDDFVHDLKACALCKVAFYCGKRCQTEHWKRGHKIDCIKNYPEKKANLTAQG